MENSRETVLTEAVAEDGTTVRTNFIKNIILEDIKTSKHNGRVQTRFPPEPNGYLHIGHSKSICLNFGFAQEFKGKCNLRFDDTNPEKESEEYVNSIIEDIRWLGFDWEERLFYASDYFEELFNFALKLIDKGLAYVDDLSFEEIQKYRGTLTEPGKESPYRNRTPEENHDLFVRMRNGEFADGSKVLRAKIDMASANVHMRDPVLYRIKRVHHHRTGDKWCIYPMYDFTHCLSDALENITHSICTLEFEEHRPLYDWVVQNADAKCHPQQIEFAKLIINYTVLSKRNLLNMVNKKIVSGWDDPRMPTISGMRRRGFTPESIRDFCDKIGVSKADSIVDIGFLHHCVRDDLNKKAIRVMGVLNPLKVIITNYPEGETEFFEGDNNPEDVSAGKRQIPFSREIFIEKEDFMEDAPKKYFRLSPGREVRLKHACYITCDEVVKDENTGEILYLKCSFDPQSRGGGTPDNRRVKGTLHWVSAKHAVKAEVRLYDHLFSVPSPGDAKTGRSYIEDLNPESLIILKDCLVEPFLRNAEPGIPYQFIRNGYFCVDPKDSTPQNIVFNRTVPLKDSWAKISKT